MLRLDVFLFGTNKTIFTPVFFTGKKSSKPKPVLPSSLCSDFGDKSFKNTCTQEKPSALLHHCQVSTTLLSWRGSNMIKYSKANLSVTLFQSWYFFFFSKSVQLHFSAWTKECNSQLLFCSLMKKCYLTSRNWFCRVYLLKKPWPFG